MIRMNPSKSEKHFASSCGLMRALSSELMETAVILADKAASCDLLNQDNQSLSLHFQCV